MTCRPAKHTQLVGKNESKHRDNNKPNAHATYEENDSQPCSFARHYNRNGSDSDNQNDNIRVGLINVRSCRNKTTEIVDMIEDHQLDVLFVTESWLSHPSDEPIIQDMTPSGYDTKSFPREDRVGGGIAIIYKSTFDNQMHFSKTNFTSFEHAMLRFNQFNSQTYFHCIYRPPPSVRNMLRQNDFLNEFRDFLSLRTTSTCSRNDVFLGDFNIDYHGDKAEAKQFRELINEHDLIQHVYHPTNNHGHTIDLVITERDFVFSSSLGNIDKQISDHHLLLFDIPFRAKRSRKIKITSRDTKRLNTQLFKDDLQQNISRIHTMDAISLNKMLLETIDTHAPLKTRILKERPPAPWFTHHVKKAKQARRKAEAKWRKSGSSDDKNEYLIQKRVAKRVTFTAKKDYYNMKFSNIKTSKEFFSLAKTLLGQTTKSFFPSEIEKADLADCFGDYFQNKIDTISASLEEHAPETDFTSFSGSHMGSFEEVTENEVKNIILSSSPKTCDLDALPTELLRLYLDDLLPSITYVMNNSLKSGAVPEIYKIALVKPLLKKDNLDKENLKNYRPVSNLPFLSKILEKIVLKQLLAHLKENALEEPFQSAYRQNHSTETALTKIVNDLLSVIDQGSVSLLNLLDLSAAFDTINHQILLERLKLTYGITGTALDWFRSYLSDRKQIVVIENDKSREFDLNYGVPQGSVLGPILFVMYIGPLSKVITDNGLAYHQYADDTQLYSTDFSKDLSPLIDTSEKCIMSIKEWMNRNRLKLNEDKTEVMKIGRRQSLSKNRESHINLCDSSIEIVDKVKNLGVHLESDLSMNYQVSSLIRTLNFQLKKISNIRPFISKDATKKLIVALMFSKLDYCNALLFGISQNNLRRLQICQNNAARLIYKMKKRDSVSSSLSKLHWLTIEKRIRFKAAVLVYRCLEGTAPQYLSVLITRYAPSRSLRSGNDKTRLVVPRSRTKVGARAFFIFGPTVWNSIPQTIREKSSLDSFKKALKTYLFI